MDEKIEFMDVTFTEKAGKEDIPSDTDVKRRAAVPYEARPDETEEED